MSCAACTSRAERVAAVTESIRASIPPLVTRALVTRLRARGVRIVENAFLPGDRKEIPFPPDVDLLLHRLEGLDLSRAVKVGFALTAAGSGELLFAADDAPFERDSGAVLVACQRHYATFPHDTVATLRVRDDAGTETTGTYVILHRY